MRLRLLKEMNGIEDAEGKNSEDRVMGRGPYKNKLT